MRTILLAVVLVSVIAQPVLAYAGAPPAAPVQATPAPQQAAPGSSGFPWMALLVLLIPLIWVAYKSRGKKSPDNINSGACLPVIDGKDSPFKPADDDES